MCFVSLLLLCSALYLIMPHIWMEARAMNGNHMWTLNIRSTSIKEIALNRRHIGFNYWRWNWRVFLTQFLERLLSIYIWHSTFTHCTNMQDCVAMRTNFSKITNGKYAFDDMRIVVDAFIRKLQIGCASWSMHTASIMNAECVKHVSAFYLNCDLFWRIIFFCCIQRRMLTCISFLAPIRRYYCVFWHFGVAFLSRFGIWEKAAITKK